jgi:hypothetical protein
MKRVQKIFNGEITGFWGAPNRRLLRDYLDISGLGERMNLDEFEPFTKDLE